VQTHRSHGIIIIRTIPTENETMAILIACDGSCIQQGDFRKGDSTDRPGAAGFVADVDGALVGKATPHGNGLIGGMEVNALLMGLRFADGLIAAGKNRDEPVRIVCDSQYAVNGFNDWLNGWSEHGHKAARNAGREYTGPSKKGGLAYADEWREIETLKGSLGKSVEVVWTKGHTTGSSRESVMNRRVDELVNGAARSQQPYDDTHKVLPAIATLADRYASVAEVEPIPVDHAQRLYDYVTADLLVPTGGPTPAEAIDSVTKPFEPIADADRFVTKPFEPIADADRFVARGDAPGRPSGAREMLDRAAELVSKGTTPEPEKPMSGIHAQALGLMAHAASNPELSGLIAQGLEMALDERRLTARYSRETVDAAQVLQAALEKRGNER
jgi:ribonuclease HI